MGDDPRSLLLIDRGVGSQRIHSPSSTHESFHHSTISGVVLLVDVGPAGRGR